MHTAADSRQQERQGSPSAAVQQGQHKNRNSQLQLIQRQQQQQRQARHTKQALGMLPDRVLIRRQPLLLVMLMWRQLCISGFWRLHVYRNNWSSRSMNSSEGLVSSWLSFVAGYVVNVLVLHIALPPSTTAVGANSNWLW